MSWVSPPTAEAVKDTEQLREFSRLWYEVVEAGCKGVHGQSNLRGARNRDHPWLLFQRERTYRHYLLKAVHAGHVDVRKDDVWSQLLDQLQRLVSTIRGRSRETTSPQQHHHAVGSICVVVNHKDNRTSV